MTILQLISSAGFYGAESMMLALAGGLQRCDCRCVVGVLEDSRFGATDVEREARRRGLPVEAVRCNGRADVQAVRRLRRLLAGLRPDILHTHGYKADVYGYAARVGLATSLVATCHNWPGRSRSMRGYAWLDRLLLRRFSSVAAASRPVAGRLREAGVRGVKEIRNGVDVRTFCTAAPVLRRQLGCGSRPLIGFAGRMVAEKGGALLLEAAGSVLAARPDALFVFVGDGPQRREWESQAEESGLDGHVIFAGTRDDMPAVYKSFDLLVLPSLTEATPMCLLEAMAAGTPVVATNVGSVPDVVLPDVTGILLEPRDTEGLAAAITRLLRDNTARRRIAERAYQHVVENFSADAMARGYLDFYEQALNGRDALSAAVRA